MLRTTTSNGWTGNFVAVKVEDWDNLTVIWRTEEIV